jgi:hypothetical protein
VNPDEWAPVSEYLDVAELRSLTGFSRALQQATWLQERGIPHRRDGKRVIISRVHVRHWLEGRTLAVSSGLNWAAIK